MFTCCGELSCHLLITKKNQYFLTLDKEFVNVGKGQIDLDERIVCKIDNVSELKLKMI